MFPPKSIYCSEKTEYMTHLYENQLVLKSHPIIAFRGYMDLLQCELILMQAECNNLNFKKTSSNIKQIASLCRTILTCEVKKISFDFPLLLGLTSEQLRLRSHYPKKYYGIDHHPPSVHSSLISLKLHRVRSLCRQTELAAINAFCKNKNKITRLDIIQALNRISSALYILALKKR